MADKKERGRYFIEKGKLFEDDPELGVRQVTRIDRMETFLSNVGASGPLEVRVNGDTIELWFFDELGYELSIGSDGELRENVDGESPYYSIHTDYEEKEEEEDENEAEYYIQNEKLLEYHPKLGVRQLTHIKRLFEWGTLERGEGLKRGEFSGSSEVRVNGDTIEYWLLEKGEWSGSLEVRVNEDVIELWLDEYFEGEDDHEA